MGLREDDERWAQPKGQSFLRQPREIQPQLTGHPPQPLVIPGMPIESEPTATLPEAPATLRDHQGR
jgi:hypothetical protein